MTPEENFNNEMWIVLQLICRKELRRPKGEPLEFVIQPGLVWGLPEDVRKKVLLKIKERGGVKIIKKRVNGKNLIFTLKLLKPKFDEIYEEYKLKNTKKGENVKSQKLTKLFFDIKSKRLCNSGGKKSQIIKGGSLRLLNCFLKNKETLKCKKSEIIKIMGGQDQYGGARRQLLSLINEVADIDSIHPKDSKKIVEYYQLKEL